MKRMKLIGLVITASIGAAALAAELQHATIQISKEEPQLLVVKAGKEVVAEIKVLKAGSLSVQAGEVVYRMAPAGGGKIYNCTGGSKAELSVEGKSLLTVSGDFMLIQPLKAGSAAGSPK